MSQHGTLRRLYADLDRAPQSDYGKVRKGDSLGDKIKEMSDFYPIGCAGVSKDTYRVMAVGADFGTIEYVDKLCAGKKDPGTTRRGVQRHLLEKLGVSTEDVFFTNFHPYCRLDEPGQGYHPMWDDGKILPFIREHFRLQISLVNPRLVLLLGAKPAWGAATTFGQLSIDKRCKGIRMRDFDKEPRWKRDGVEFVVVTHPSHYNNSTRRHMKMTERELLEECAADLGFGRPTA